MLSYFEVRKSLVLTRQNSDQVLCECSFILASSLRKIFNCTLQIFVQHVRKKLYRYPPIFINSYAYPLESYRK